MSLTEGNGPAHGGTCPLCGGEYGCPLPTHINRDCDADVVEALP